MQNRGRPDRACLGAFPAIDVAPGLHAEEVVTEVRAVAEDAEPIALMLAVQADEAAPAFGPVAIFVQAGGAALIFLFAHALVKRVEQIAPVQQRQRWDRSISESRRESGGVGPGPDPGGGHGGDGAPGAHSQLLSVGTSYQLRDRGAAEQLIFERSCHHRPGEREGARRRLPLVASTTSMPLPVVTAPGPPALVIRNDELPLAVPPLMTSLSEGEPSLPKKVFIAIVPPAPCSWLSSRGCPAQCPCPCSPGRHW